MRKGQWLMFPSESFCRERRAGWWEGSDGLAQAMPCCWHSRLHQGWDPTPVPAPCSAPCSVPCSLLCSLFPAPCSAPCQLQPFLHSPAAAGGTGASPVTRESLSSVRSNCTKLDHVPQNQICLANPLIDFKALLRLKDY